jgi:hypothetical protein
LLLQVDMFQVLADIIGAILNFLKPIVSPIGAWMVNWINTALQFFPTDSLTIYIIIFIILLVSGGLVNSLWPGDKPPKFSKQRYDLIPDQKIKEVDEEYKAVTAGEDMDTRDDLVELKDDDE